MRCQLSNKIVGIVEQAEPSQGQEEIWPLVIDDMKQRDSKGRSVYGTPLMSHNGRDALIDAYQEALDLAVYLRQEIQERTTIQEIVDMIKQNSEFNNVTSTNIKEVIKNILCQRLI